jgi:CubicO group peptidase (beta-lactamase class C family)
MYLTQTKKIDLNQKTSNLLSSLKPFQNLTLEKLLTHQSCLNLTQKYSKNQNYNTQQIREILFNSSNLEIQKTNLRFNYSDLNYIYLGEILPKLIGFKGLETALNSFLQKFELDFVFNPLLKNIPISEIVPSSQNTPAGIVHDPKARWLGGVAGSAGLFGNLGSLQKFTEIWLKNDFKLNSDLYKQSLYPTVPWYFSNSQPIFGDVWRIGKYSQNPNHAGFTGPSIMVDPKKQFAIIHLNNYLFESEAEQHRTNFLSWNTELLGQAYNF